MTIVGWASVAVGCLAALGLAVLAWVVRSGARDASDRRFAWGLALAAVAAVGVPALGVALGHHGHATAAWAVALATLALDAAALALLPKAISAAAQP